MGTIRIQGYTNSDDAFVAWAPDEFIPGCRGFRLDRASKASADAEDASAQLVVVENRVGFESDNPQSGQHRPSNIWPFQRFNWTDHAVDVGSCVRYRVAPMLRDQGGSLVAGPASDWTPWLTLSPEAGDGFSCYFNRGLILSQFVARYLREKKITARDLKDELRKGSGSFRRFLQGDLGKKLFELLDQLSKGDLEAHAALYELDDDRIEQGISGAGDGFNLILANGSDKKGDGNADAREFLANAGHPPLDRLLGNKGLGHNKFMVLGRKDRPEAVWTGSTNWSTTGLCTQINNALLVANDDLARIYRDQWDALAKASPPETNPASFTDDLVGSNDKSHQLDIGPAKLTVWFTPTSDERDLNALKQLIAEARESILFLMFTPGPTGLHTAAAARAGEKSMYVRGVVSTLGQTKADNDKNVLDVDLVSSGGRIRSDHYDVVQPQGEDGPIGPWIEEVTRRYFLSQVGHAIVHSKVLVIDHMSDDPIVVTGSHNFSKSASQHNDENLLIIRGHKALARAYAVNVMSVYQHYRYRSYIREMIAQGKEPWSYLDDDDHWLRVELKSKAQEIGFWTGS